MMRFAPLSFATAAAVCITLALAPSAAWANGTPYYFDVDGATPGFDSPSGTYNQNGAFWSTSSAGTDPTVAFPADGQLTFGNVGSDLAGTTFTINLNSYDWMGLAINSNSADVTLIGTANAYSSYGGPYTWTVASGSTLTEAVTWTGNGHNFNNQQITLLGGGTVNFNTALGRNSGAPIIQDGPTVNIQPVADYSGVVGTGGYVLDSGTLNFANALAFSNLNTRGSGKLTLNGGTIDNTSGAAGTFTNNNGVNIGGDFTFTGSNDLSLGTAGVALTASPIITVSAGNLTVEGAVSGGFGITKAGAGTLVFTAANSYSGGTTVSEGTLVYQGTYASPSHAIAGGAVLELNVASGTTDYASTTFSGAGTLQKTGSGMARWPSTAATFAMDSGAMIDVQAGHFVGGSSANENWTNNKSDLNVALGATFSGVEANVRVDALTGQGTIRSGYTGAGYQSFTFGVDNGGGTFDGILADTGSGHVGNFTKAGSGTQILSGDNTYTGTTTIDGGTLVFNTPSFNTYNGAGIVINNGSTVQITQSGGYTRYDFGTTWTFDATGGGTIATGPGLNYVFSADNTFVTTGGARNNINGSSSINMNGKNIVFDVAPGTDGTSDLHVALALGNSSGGLTKIGSGILTLTASNAYTGATTVNAGELVYQSTYASTSHSIAGGAVLELNVASGTRDYASTTFSGAGTLQKTGSGTARWPSTAATFAMDSGAMIDVQAGHFVGGSYANENWTNNKSDLNVAAGATFSGVEANVRVDALTGQGTISSGYGGAGYQNFTFGVDNGSGTFDGVLANGSAAGNYVKAGSGTQVLTGKNTYTGTTTIDGGTLVLHGGSSLYTYTGGNIYINNGSTLRIERGSYNQYWFNNKNFIFDSNGGGTIDTTSGLNFVVYGGSTVTTNGGAQNSIIGSSGINLHAGHTLNFDVAAGTGPVDLEVSAPLWNSGRIYKTGDGTLALTATTSSYSGGTTIDEGTLLVNNTSGSGTGSGAVTVSGGTLGGTGTISGAVTFTTGGTLSPGASIGTLTTGTLTLSSASNSLFELTTPWVYTGVDYNTPNDLVIVNGDLTLGGTLTLDPQNTLPNGDYTLFVYSGVLDPDGAFDSVSFTWGGVGGSIWIDDSNGAVNLNVVPEPSTLAMLLGLAGIGLLGYLRRRRRS